MDDKSTARVDRIVRWAFRFIRNMVAFSAVVAAGCFIRYRWLEPSQKINCQNFFFRVFDSSLSALSKTRLGFFYEGLISAILASVLLFLLLRRLSPNEELLGHAKNALLALLVGTLIPTFTLFSTMAWKVVTAVYDDHHDNLGRLKYVIDERVKLKGLLTDRDKYIKQLEGKECPKSPNIRHRLEAPAPQNTVITLTLKVVARCTLRTPPDVPPDVYRTSWTNPDMSYLEGPLGREYLDTPEAVTYKRGDDNRSASFTQIYPLRAGSSLIGEPFSSLDKYYAHLAVWAMETKFFSECNFLETTLNVNGNDVWVRQRPSGPLPITLEDQTRMNFGLK